MPEIPEFVLLKYADAIGHYYNGRKTEVEKVMREEIRLLLKQLISFTPPIKPPTMAHGRKVVNEQIQYSIGYLPFFLKTFRNKRIIELIEKKNAKALTEIFANMRGGAFKDSVVGPFDHKMHTENRNKRGGVRKRKTWKKSTVDSKAVKKYIKERQANVGMARGGWAKAYAYFGGKPPNWYKRHDNQGTLDASKLKDPFRQSALLTNWSPWARGKGTSDQDVGGKPSAEPMAVVREAMRSRTKHLRSRVIKSHERAIKNRLKVLQSRGLAA